MDRLAPEVARVVSSTSFASDVRDAKLSLTHRELDSTLIRLVYTTPIPGSLDPFGGGEGWSVK